MLCDIFLSTNKYLDKNSKKLNYEDILFMHQNNSKKPMHGVTLEKMINTLVDYYGWEKLGKRIKIKCFNNDPSVKSSLKFIRKTSWAREKVEGLYRYTVRRINEKEAKRKNREQREAMLDGKNEKAGKVAES